MVLEADPTLKDWTDFEARMSLVLLPQKPSALFLYSVNIDLTIKN
jgi:hypothetical protein